jgi:hypothetical protein
MERQEDTLPIARAIVEKVDSIGPQSILVGRTGPTMCPVSFAA